MPPTARMHTMRTQGGEMREMLRSMVIDQDQDDDQCILYLSYGYTHMLDPVDADLFIELELWRLKM